MIHATDIQSRLRQALQPHGLHFVSLSEPPGDQPRLRLVAAAIVTRPEPCYDGTTFYNQTVQRHVFEGPTVEAILAQIAHL